MERERERERGLQDDNIINPHETLAYGRSDFAALSIFQLKNRGFFRIGDGLRI